MTESDANVLFVRHLPIELSFEDREELLKIFGAKKVRCMPDVGKLKCTAFATFENNEIAKHALSKLHQLEILNKKLVVEFAKKHQEEQFPKLSDFPTFKPANDNEGSAKVSVKEKLSQESTVFAKNLHGICPTQGLDYLPSPLLKYSYPPPTPSIIANISHALAAVPKFYTQVLHLMNKMNLPAPFGPVTMIPPLNADEPLSFQHATTEQEYYTDKIMVEEMDTGSEEESELESEVDEKTLKQDTVLPVKRPANKSRKRQKKPKLSQLLATASYSAVKSNEPHAQPSDVFELQPASDQRKINFNIKQNLDTDRKEPEHFVEEIQENIGSVQATAKLDVIKHVAVEEDEEVNSEDEWKNSQFISLRELKRKRISDHEMRTLSAFKNYAPGEPSVRLYIKNLARQVDEKDLRYVFGRFVNQDSESDRNMFDVRLMKEGRMKGQAFITLASEKQAISAVRECNGYVLHTKPLVVQFARSAKPKENTTTTKSAKKS